MRAWIVVVLATLVGCGGPDLRTLTRDDVSVVPTGDAIGMQFSGEYVVTANRIEACRCRTGSCAVLVGNVGGLGAMVQMDGSLQYVDPATSQGAPGGVNADGSFHLVYLVETTGNIQYGLLDGRFTLSAGAPVSFEAIQQATGVNGGFNCDIRTAVTAAYVGPLQAALAAGVPVTSETNPSDAPHAGLGLLSVAAQ
jgi:hypothetical protein